MMCYFQLCNEDYRWWWRSYLSAGSSGGYLFLYSIWYYFSKLNITGFTASALYFSYMAMVSLTFAMLTGDDDDYDYDALVLFVSSTYLLSVSKFLSIVILFLLCCVVLCVCVYCCSYSVLIVFPLTRSNLTFISFVQVLLASSLAYGSCVKFTRPSRSIKIRILSRDQ